MTTIRPDELALLVAWNKAHRELIDHLRLCDDCDADDSHNSWMCEVGQKLNNDQALLCFKSRRVIDDMERRAAEKEQGS